MWIIGLKGWTVQWVTKSDRMFTDELLTWPSNTRWLPGFDWHEEHHSCFPSAMRWGLKWWMQSPGKKATAIWGKCLNNTSSTMLSWLGTWKMQRYILDEIRMHTENNSMLLYQSCALRVLKMSTQLSESVYMSRQWIRCLRPDAQRIAELIVSASK